MTTLDDRLTEAGFQKDGAFRDGLMEYAAQFQLSDSGPYDIKECYTKGAVSVTVEQNTAPEDLGGMQATVTHPPVAIVVGPKGRVAVNPNDADLVVQVADELA